MKKNINNINKIIFLSLIFIISIILIFFIPITPYDELWYFQNIYKMCNGYIIYKDANVIVTPIFFFLESFILSILGANFFVYRITNILISIAIYFCLYKIIRSINIDKYISIFILTIIFAFQFNLIANGANYNALSQLFFYIGLLCYINKNYSNITQGIILFLIFFTKQNLGIYYAFGMLIYELFLYKLSLTFITRQLKKFIIFIIPSILLLLYMYFKGILYDFINHTFGGIFEFSNNVSFSSQSIHIILYSIITTIFILFMKKKFINWKVNPIFFDNLTLLLIFSVFMTFIIYPLANKAHVNMILPLYIIMLFYIFNTLIFTDFFKIEKFYKLLQYISMTLLMYLILQTSYTLISQKELDDTIFISIPSNPYFGTFIKANLYNDIRQIQEYILEKNSNGIDVIICSYDSAFIMIPLKQSHGDYDLIFYGNIGYNGIKKLEEDIISKEHTEFLIINSENDMFFQEIKEIRNFIINNLQKCGEISNYDIYYK